MSEGRIRGLACYKQRNNTPYGETDDASPAAGRTACRDGASRREQRLPAGYLSR